MLESMGKRSRRRRQDDDVTVIDTVDKTADVATVVSGGSGRQLRTNGMQRETARSKAKQAGQVKSSVPSQWQRQRQRRKKIMQQKMSVKAERHDSDVRESLLLHQRAVEKVVEIPRRSVACALLRRCTVHRAREGKNE